LPGAAEIAQGLVISEIRWRNQSAASCPKDVAEIEAGRDLADLIANPVREERGLGVVEDDLTDFKELLFAHSSSKYHCIEDYFFNARMLPRNIVVLQ
jgi:hypothetical protein